MTPPPLLRTLLCALAVCAAAAPALAAPPSPPTLPGWPKEVAARAVLQGPSGGVVAVSSDRALRYTVRAWRRDGRLLRSATDSGSCGNCGLPFGGEALQPDGTYGPIGGESGPWKVYRRGTVVRPGCGGVVSPDGGCAVGGLVVVPGPSLAPGVNGLRPDGTRWEVGDPRFRWNGDGTNLPPKTVADSAGTVYVAFSAVLDATTGARFPGLLIAVDPVAHTLLWGRVGPDEVLTALGAGVLVRRGGALVAVGSDGSARWTRFVAGVSGAESDATRSRLYVARGSGVVVALDAATGAEIWRTRASERTRLLTVGRGGRVYVAIDGPGRPAVRALRLRTGATAWERRAGLPFRAARELTNGMVAIGGSQALTLVDPR